MNRYIDLVFKFKDYKNTQDFKNILKSIIVTSESFKNCMEQKIKIQKENSKNLFYKHFIQFNKKKKVESTLLK